MPIKGAFNFSPRHLMLRLQALLQLSHQLLFARSGLDCWFGFGCTANLALGLFVELVDELRDLGISL